MDWSFKYVINYLAKFKLNVLPGFCLLKLNNARNS